MIRTRQSKGFALILGDIVLLYFGLVLTLIIRYGSDWQVAWATHRLPFFVIYFVWIIIFYIFDFYETKKIISARSLEMQIIRVMALVGIVSIIIFYAFPFFLITPKTNLLINLIICTLLFWLWRRVFYFFLSGGEKIKLLFLGSSSDIKELVLFIKNRPHLGFETAATIEAGKLDGAFFSMLKNREIDLVVISRESEDDRETVRQLYKQVLPLGISIIGFDKFYESVTGKIPVYQINENWFLENFLEINKKTFEKIKEWLDFGLGILLSFALLMLFPFVAAAIKLNSRGPVLYKQKRVGRNGKIFELVKFRSMVKDAEKNGAEWAAIADNRITAVGNFLRKTRIDELPQVWNIIKGELSFVGPRPERPEFVEQLNKKIPHYATRHLVKPGLSGWAQINFPYGASVEDATEKLQYDLYYIKNRSILLDLVIALKTIAILLRREGR